MQIGTLAKLTSQIALKRASDRDVKRFATYEIAEQTAVAQDLTDQRNPPPAKLTAAQQQILDRLGGLSGAEFDRQYIAAQIHGHEQLRQIQQSYFRSGNNRDLLHIANLALPTINEHLDHLRELRAAGRL